EGTSYCSLFSSLRRGILYNVAEELGCSKIALGHHRDDAIETLLLNLTFAGSLHGMPAKLRSKDGRNVVIRPLLYAREDDLAALAQAEEFPILPSNLCGSQENLMRKQIKSLLREFESRAPEARSSMLAAMTHVKPSHLLDRSLIKRLGLDEGSGKEHEDPPPPRSLVGLGRGRHGTHLTQESAG